MAISRAQLALRSSIRPARGAFCAAASRLRRVVEAGACAPQERLLAVAPRWFQGARDPSWPSAEPASAGIVPAGASADTRRAWGAEAIFGGLAVSFALALLRPSRARCDESSEFRLFPKDLEELVKPTAENPAPVSVPPPFPGLAKQQWTQRFVAPLFGLPYCGKAYVAHSLKRYINFFHGARAEVFHVSDYLGSDGEQALFRDLADFFHADSGWQDAYAFARTVSKPEQGGFAILLSSDSVESTASRWSPHSKWHRRWMTRELEANLAAEVCFIQVSVDAAKGRKYVEDLTAYRGKSLDDVEAMIEAYEEHYEPIFIQDLAEQRTPFVQVRNYLETLVVNRMLQSFVGSAVCHFLSNLHPYKHKVYVSRHGESEFNVEKRLGGDSGLAARGREYARRLAEFSHYVIAGHATDLVFVTLPRQCLQGLRQRLDEKSDVDACGIFAKGSWADFGDASGASVLVGMQLVRLQAGFGAEFSHAPDTIDQLFSMVDSDFVTLAFVEGDAAAPNTEPARLWTSSLRRTIETADFINQSTIVRPNGKQWTQFEGKKFRNLDEVYAGSFDGLTEAEIKQRAPDVIMDRKRDKFGFRYPRGESYYDIIARLESVMVHLERIQEPILLISHQAVLRLIIGWLMHMPREEALDLTVPQHEVVSISWDGLGGGPRERRHPLGPTWLPSDGQTVLL